MHGKKADLAGLSGAIPGSAPGAAAAASRGRRPARRCWRPAASAARPL